MTQEEEEQEEENSGFGVYFDALPTSGSKAKTLKKRYVACRTGPTCANSSRRSVDEHDSCTSNCCYEAGKRDADQARIKGPISYEAGRRSWVWQLLQGSQAGQPGPKRDNGVICDNSDRCHTYIPVGQLVLAPEGPNISGCWLLHIFTAWCGVYSLTPSPRPHK